jgi:hypothetical protein
MIASFDDRRIFRTDRKRADLQRGLACAQMSLMRAAPPVPRLPRALLAGAALATAAVALAALPPGAANPAGAGRSAAAADPTAASTRGFPAGSPPAPARPPAQDLLLACPTTRDYVGRVVATVMVDGKGPFRFIIDTGANESTISPKLAVVLGLEPSASDTLRVAGVTGTAMVPSVRIDSLRAGDVVISHTSLPVLWSPVMAGADGILGAAGLAHDTLFVDFRHDTVTIRRADGAAVPAGYTRIRARRIYGGLLSLSGEVGNVPITAIIDTGSPQTLGNLALFRALYSHPQAGKPVVASVYGATRQVSLGSEKLAPTIDLGAIQIGNPLLIFGDFPIFKLWGLTRRPAIILGMDVLGTVDAFSIDFQHAEIDVAPQYDLMAHIPVTG